MGKIFTLILAAMIGTSASVVPVREQPLAVHVVQPAAGEEDDPWITHNEVILLAKCVFAEAGNQDETGKRLVAATVFNRMETAGFPDTAYEVITQPNQFVYADTYTQECYDAVVAEMCERTDTRVLYFWNTGYPPYGVQLYQHGGHYFSGKPE